MADSVCTVQSSFSRVSVKTAGSLYDGSFAGSQRV